MSLNLELKHEEMMILSSDFVTNTDGAFWGRFNSDTNLPGKIFYLLQWKPFKMMKNNFCFT